MAVGAAVTIASMLFDPGLQCLHQRRNIGQNIDDDWPDSTITPAQEAHVDTAPAPFVRLQFVPDHILVDDPQHLLHEAAVVTRIAPRTRPHATWQVRKQLRPLQIGQPVGIGIASLQVSTWHFAHRHFNHLLLATG